MQSNNEKSQKQFFIDTIAKFCDKCGSAYSVDDLELIQDTPISSIIHFSCSNCKASHIATFLKPMGISNRTPINTDLEVEEIKKFAKREETSTEEILNLYLYLKENRKVRV
ncbi:MAG: hypothetical protein XD93_0195 [candidate division WS6 bacterium 34_10]|jgi:hypothetical protein|uniref:Uncharacterized protein n=1 Tax=candidate division WS6 bacterium 34_10 TaxID=1641389 RepID=A0A101HIU4_9BACT|nr:MAG: hypothetical protein XD93_0195 [candidate division WS6 bacterium 34_10]